MPKTYATGHGPPQLSFTSFLMGGDFIINTKRSRALVIVEKMEKEKKKAEYNKKRQEFTDSLVKKIGELAAAGEAQRRIEKSNETKEIEPKKKEKEKHNASKKSVEKEKKKKDNKEKDVDAKKTAEQEKKDKEKPHAEAQEGGKSHNKQATPIKHAATGSKFTEEQDATILAMMLDDKPWAEICSSVRAGKKSIQSRFEELQALGRAFTTDVEVGSPAATTEKDETIEISTVKPSNEPMIPCFEDATPAPPRVSPPKERSKLFEGGAIEDQPPSIPLQADGNWTKQDCELLTMLEKRYRDHKWLHMQANFYNHTGRMVQAEVIKWKFGFDK